MKELEKMKQEKDKQAAIGMLMDMILDSDDAPEDMKLDFKLIKARHALFTPVSELIEDLTLSRDKYTTEQKKEALEYLSYVTQGVNQYISEMAKQ